MKLFERTYTETRMAHAHHSKRRTKQQQQMMKKISLTRQCHQRTKRNERRRRKNEREAKLKNKECLFLLFGWNDQSKNETRLITLRRKEEKENHG